MDASSQDIGMRAFKVILVGAQSVGKSSILCQLINSQFPTAYQATVGIDYHTYSSSIAGKTYSLQVWDTAGQEKFRALTSTYYKSCNGCICVYDLSDPSSLEKADYYLTKATEEDIPISCTFLVGNKVDLLGEEEPSSNSLAKEGAEKAEKYGVEHRLVSAKEGAGVLELFESLAGNMVKHFGGSLENRAVQLLPRLQITNRENCKC